MGGVAPQHALVEGASACRPPRDVAELLARARLLEGAALTEVSLRSAGDEPSTRRTKGSVGQLLERALGADGGSASAPDFAELGVELKTIPLDAQGRVRESTFVCRLSLRAVDELDFEASPVFAKLRQVLWVPIVRDLGRARVGRALLWSPTPAQQAVLRADFDDLVGMIALGHIESVTARLGRWLQLRPKAAHGRVRTRAFDREGPLLTMPRGFYLRARFTSALLRDPETLAGS